MEASLGLADAIEYRAAAVSGRPAGSATDQGFVDQNADQPAAKCTFTHGEGRGARSRKPAPLHRLGRSFVIENATCKEIQRGAIAGELAVKFSELLLKTMWVHF